LCEGEAVTDEHYMKIALQEAARAYDEDEVPVGCVIVSGDRVIARAHNQKEQLHDPTAHAEMIAITQAAESLQNWCLQDCVAYVTLEPCAMCAGAFVLARIRKLVFGADDSKTGACGSVFDLASNTKLNHRIEVVRAVLAEESSRLLQKFFQSKRASLN